MCSPVLKELVGCTSLELQPGAAGGCTYTGPGASTTQGAWLMEPTNPRSPQNVITTKILIITNMTEAAF